MMQQHRKLIKTVEVTDSTYVRVPVIAQSEEPFNTKCKPIILEQPQQSVFVNYVKEKLDKLKYYLQPPHKIYFIKHGGHNNENDKCPLNNQFQQNQNVSNKRTIHLISKDTQNILPLVNPSGNINQLHFQEKLNLKAFQKGVQKHCQTYKHGDTQFDQLKPKLEYERKEQMKRESKPKLKCKCQQCDIVLDQSNENEIVMQLKQFQLQTKVGNEMVSRKTIHYEKDLFKLESLKEEGRIKKFEFQETFPKIKLNQNIGKWEQKMFEKTGQYWTSSMIDGYGNYLSGLDERYYFSLSSAEREQYPRLFIFTSDFLTNCNLESPPLKEKWLLLILEKLELFKTIQYQFWLIYQKIAFIVNKNNSHWYMLTLDLKERFMVIYDSLSGSSQHYHKVRALLSYVFYELQKNQLKNIKEDQYEFKMYFKPKFQSQNDSYSCGYHTCIALEYFSNTHRVKDFKEKKDIKSDLKDIFYYEQL
ncbi:unnamed protein product (macronuclear) [Paramecium tetraurelia]|uniref:Ubiquitin-like protease family profile domain-containing protein n=1 Tax=Paramecium tetraurelia TaxID=5888 RepID=A0CF57_PARTE|nr:uncharacterized protein GSPATT00037863001 [Paramecium tetraurelia]CAK69424.1 unnamed protein product [Paramecium tetraurelia]|eukprot:XP_001436821.1 hypothetical protein (macronuclear) [Paramecium tetraurelia strain d4-2]